MIWTIPRDSEGNYGNAICLSDRHLARLSDCNAINLSELPFRI